MSTKRPLTPADFKSSAGSDITTLPMTEGEDGEHYGYGHIDPAEFAAAATAIDTALGCDFFPGEEFDAGDVEHRWALTTMTPEEGGGEWGCEWTDATTPGAWPITVLIP